MRALLLLVAPLAAWADCPAPVAPDTLASTLASAEAAFGNFDEDSFVQSMDEASVQLPCLASPVAPPLAAHTHRMFGLLRYGAEGDKAFVHLIAARRLEPEATLSEDLLPPTHPIQVAWPLLDYEDVPTDRAPKPKIGTLLFDGTESRDRPVSVPTLFQYVSDTDGSVSSHYLLPDDPLPEYPRVQGRRNALLTTSIACLVGSAGAYGAAWVTKASFDEGSSIEQIDAMRRTNHALVIGSGVLLGASVGTGSAAFLVKSP